MRLVARALIAAAFLASCSVLTHDRTFSKPGASDADWKRDSYECERDAGLARQPGPPNGRFYARCLEARGWKLD